MTNFECHCLFGQIKLSIYKMSKSEYAEYITLVKKKK